jgi:hypothetical protein
MEILLAFMNLLEWNWVVDWRGPRTVRRPSEMEPTNLNVETVLDAIASKQSPVLLTRWFGVVERIGDCFVCSDVEVQG